MRDLRFIAYFRQCLPKDLEITSYADLTSRLASLPPFELCLSKINVTYLHCQVSIFFPKSEQKKEVKL
jgi:polynucleotide 5'-hydroxyl-kinase GRC3/NOL9